MSRLVAAWDREHGPRRVTYQERCIRLDGLPVALWDPRTGRAVPHVDPALGLSERLLEALLEQVGPVPPEEIALALEVRLEQLLGG